MQDKNVYDLSNYLNKHTNITEEEKRLEDDKKAIEKRLKELSDEKYSIACKVGSIFREEHLKDGVTYYFTAYQKTYACFFYWHESSKVNEASIKQIDLTTLNK